MRAVVHLLGLIYCALAVVDSEKCGHAPPQVIDWSRVPNKLYLVLDVGDPLATIAECYVIHDFVETGKRVTFITDDYRLENGVLTRGKLNMHYTRKPSGGYTLSQEDVEPWEHEFDKSATEKQVHDMSEELPQLARQELFGYTDYQNYLIVTMCGDNGERYLWVHHVRRHPTEADLQHVKDKLEEIGGGWNKVPLEVGGCTKLEKYPGYAALAEEIESYKKCAHGPPQVIDWSKVPRKMFLILDLGDPITEITECFALHDFIETKDKLTLIADDFRLENGVLKKGKISMHFTRKASGGYTLAPEDVKPFERELEPSATAKQAQDMDEELPQLVRHESFVYTDYTHYLIITMCGDKGERFMWIHHVRRHPTVSDLQQIRAKLKQIGAGWDQVPLEVEGCTKLESFPGYAALAEEIGDFKKCGHAPPQVINWSRVPKKLYLILDVGDPISEITECYVLHDFFEAGNRMTWIGDDYRIENGVLTRGRVKTHFIRHSSGGYSLVPEDVDPMRDELDQSATPKQAHDLDDELAQVIRHEAFFYTDYKNYLIMTMCADNGERYLWIDHVRRHPTEADIQQVKDKLKEIGGGWDELSLEVEGCTRLESMPGYEALAAEIEDPLDCERGPVQVIDWKRVPKIYLILDVGDPLTEIPVCYVSHDFVETEQGVQFIADDYRIEGGVLTKGKITMHFIRHSSGGYSWAPEDVDSIKKEFDHTATEKQAHDLDEELPQLVRHDMFLYTDYENYLLGTMCVDNGKRYLWAHTTIRHPTEANLQQIKDKLKEIGGGWDEVPLEVAGCTRLETYPGYEALADEIRRDEL